MPQRSILNQVHPTYDADTWGDYHALYAGGRAFQKRVARFLLQNPQEPDSVYQQRQREAHYRCYLGGIVDYFAAYLFTSSIVVRAKDGIGQGAKEVQPDDFYARFKEDCDRQDDDIAIFMRRRVTEAMQKRRSWWLVEMPQTEVAEGEAAAGTSLDRATWEKLGLGDAHLCALDAEQVLDWECNEHNQLTWAIVFEKKVSRPSPMQKRQQVTECWRIFDRQNVEVFELAYDANQPPSADVEVPSTGKRPHGFSRVPLVCLDLDEGLWVANRIASPQLEHFRQSNALAWSIRRTCYAMPVFKVEDGENNPPRMGAGYYLIIGREDGFEWSAPPAAPYAEIREEIRSQKDEIFRIIHQMAQGVENNAAAVGRSAQSKEADAQAVQVILSAMGGVLREAIERTYELVSEGREDAYVWSIEGLDAYEQPDIGPLVQAITEALLVDIPSPTFNREVKKRLASALLPDVAQEKKDAIAKEIDANVTDESVLEPKVPEVEGQEPDGDEPPGAEGAPAAPKGPKSRPPARAAAAA